MFLEYSIDNKEEDIYPSSIELRKRLAGRRARVTDEKVLLKLKDMVKEEQLKNGSDVLDVTLAEVASKTTLTRMDHHMKIESSMQTLERDLGRASRMSK